jgi:hypothetical protein
MFWLWPGDRGLFSKKPTTVAGRGFFVEIRFSFDKPRPRRR